MRVALWVAAVSCISGCGGTRLMVRVDPPKDASKAGFHAVVGQVDDRCVPAGPLDVTDADGVAHISEQYCGELQLVVAARGYTTARRVLDTCEVEFARVEIKPAPPVSYASDTCSTAALSVMRIWLSRDADALRSELVNPEDLPLYLRESTLEPWQIELAPSQTQGDECSVSATLLYEEGCESVVRVDLLRVGEAWRLRGVQDGQS